MIFVPGRNRQLVPYTGQAFFPLSFKATTGSGGPRSLTTTWKPPEERRTGYLDLEQEKASWFRLHITIDIEWRLMMAVVLLLLTVMLRK